MSKGSLVCLVGVEYVWGGYVQEVGTRPTGMLSCSLIPLATRVNRPLEIYCGADVTRSLEQLYQWPHKNDFPSNVLYFVP